MLADPVVLDEFRAAMDDDLDTPRVVDVVFRAVRQFNTLLDAGDTAAAVPLAAAVVEVLGAVGLELHGTGASVPAEVQALATERDEARAARDWARADALRDRLQADGWVVEDTPEGTKVRPA